MGRVNRSMIMGTRGQLCRQNRRPGTRCGGQDGQPNQERLLQFVQALNPASTSNARVRRMIARFKQKTRHAASYLLVEPTMPALEPTEPESRATFSAASRGTANGSEAHRWKVPPQIFERFLSSRADCVTVSFADVTAEFDSLSAVVLSNPGTPILVPSVPPIRESVVKKISHWSVAFVRDVGQRAPCSPARHRPAVQEFPSRATSHCASGP